MALYAKPIEGQELLSFLFVEKLKVVHDFLCLHATRVLGIESYPSAGMSCCSDDLARPLKSGI